MKVNGHTLTKLIGNGSFGKIYLSSQGYAVKEINTDGMPDYLRKSLQTQIAMLAQINHPNVVRFKENFYVKKVAYLVMEYCSEDLKVYLRRNGGCVGEKEALRILKQLIEGFRGLSKHSIIHRDLKPANILVKNGGQNQDSFKLADFGFAKYLQGCESHLLQSIVGTPLYMAPQILEKKGYTKKCDIWSLGLIFFEMITGVLPWGGNNESELIKNIRTKPLCLPNFVSQFSKMLLTRTLSNDESQRITWEQLFQFFPQQRVILRAPPLNRPSTKDRGNGHFGRKNDNLADRPRARVISINGKLTLDRNTDRNVSKDEENSRIGRNRVNSLSRNPSGEESQNIRYIRTNSQKQIRVLPPPRTPANQHKVCLREVDNNKYLKSSQALLQEIFQRQYKMAFGVEALSRLLQYRKAPQSQIPPEVVQRIVVVLQAFQTDFQEFIKQKYRV